MQEPTIGELVRIESGYTSYVDLRLELYDDSRNIGRMERYRPITSHRQAFQTLAKSLHIKDGRCYLLTGSYGTGKSHLCLMFANYLQTPAGAPPMPQFFANYAEAGDTSRAEANTLQTLRASGRYLIALCQWGGKEDFDEVVLKAVDEALKREDFGEDFDTQYLQAIKKIEEWVRLADMGSSRFSDDFEFELANANAGVTVNSFKQKLRANDYEALQEFKRIHLKVTTAPFTLDKTNLIEILIATLASDRFKQRYKGLLVLFDEFGDTMEHGRLSPKAFQQFAQLCAEPPANCANLIFVGTAHKGLTDYAKSYNAVDFRTASDRIKQVGLTPDGVEVIISAIVAPQKQHPLWRDYVEPRMEVFDTFGADCTRLKLFEWLKAPEVRTKIIENIYPMHPMATFALLQLARDVASNNRSIYTFFSEDAPGSYADFIRAAPILKGEKLHLYTVDRLCDYFAETLKSDNKELRDTVREQIRDYEYSLRALNQVSNSDSLDSFKYKGDELIPRLLRAMLVYEIIGKQNRIDNLAFGLYCTTPSERAELKNRLEELVAKDVLYLVKETGVYEFKRSKAVNLDGMIEAWIKGLPSAPQNMVVELNELVPLDKTAQYLEAKGYNIQYSEDKQLLRRFVRAPDLGTVEETPQGKRNCFQKLEDEIAVSIAKKNEYEGIALYVVCETAEDISKAKDFAARNESSRIVVAIPRQPVPLLEAILEYRALLAIEKSAEYQNFSTQDKSAFRDRMDGDGKRPGAKQALIKLRDQLLNVKEVTWHGKFAQAIATDDTNPYDVANRMMEQLYGRRNTFTHDDFNKLHNKVEKTKSQALKEAVEKLMKFTEPIAIETDLPQQRGDYRYLTKCLLQQGVLRQVKTDGATLRCEFEENPAQFAAKLPALAQMVCDVRNLGAGETLRIADLVQKYRQPPYGQGPVALLLALACLRHLFRDSIRFKIDATALGDMPVRTFDDALLLIDGGCPNAFLSYRPLNAAEKAVVETVYTTFGAPDSATVKDYTVVEAHAALKSWWDALPTIARVAQIYPQGEPEIAPFIAALQKVAGRDPHAFLFEELPLAFGFDGGLMVTSEMLEAYKAGLPACKARIEAGLPAIEDRILNGVRELFNVEQNTYTDIIAGINQWYNGLDGVQRDPFAKWQSNDSKPLILGIKSLSDLRKTFLLEIPKWPEYGGRPIKDWATDKVTEYLMQLRRGKEHVESNRIKVLPPTVEVSPTTEWLGEGKLSFKDKTEIRFKKPGKGTKLYIAEGNADPTDAGAVRKEIDSDEAITIQENKTLRYAVQDSEGNWSPVQVVQLTNANAPYLPTIGQPDLIYQRRPVQFNLRDADSLRIACRELFRKCVQVGILNADELEAVVTEALQGAKEAQ